MIRALAVLVCLITPVAAQETLMQKPPLAIYHLQLNQSDRDRMDELIVELRQLNTGMRKFMAAAPEQKPRKPRRSRRKR